MNFNRSQHLLNNNHEILQHLGRIKNQIIKNTNIINHQFDLCCKAMIHEEKQQLHLSDSVQHVTTKSKQESPLWLPRDIFGPSSAKTYIKVSMQNNYIRHTFLLPTHISNYT